MKTIDIIVPIYNAYEFTEECIKSIIKNTDLNKHTLVLINDKSPDEKILPMLNKYKNENEDKKIVVLDNEKNMGFVRTVNKGMKYSKNDVILLNSDTYTGNNPTAINIILASTSSSILRSAKSSIAESSYSDNSYLEVISNTKPKYRNILLK